MDETILWSDEYPEHRGQPGWPIPDDDEREAIFAAHAQTFADATLSPVLVVDGHGLAVKVKDGCLLLEDGFRAYPRVRTITPLEKTVRTVVVLGVGFVTTEALLWCVEHGVELAVLRSGSRPTSMTPGLLYDNAGLRRAQARAAGTTKGVDIFRHLARQRITDMADICRRLDLGRAALIKERLAHLDSLRTVHAIQVAAESQAAKVYWGTWRREVELHFDWAAPDYYRTFTSRRSPVAFTPVPGQKVRATAKTIAERRSNRHAVVPANALLNLGYKAVEAQAIIAMIGAGLDPGMGLAHVDTGRPGTTERPSGALDLLEVGRGVAERHVLDLIDSRRFSRADFRRMPHGELRVGPPLSHEMVRHITEQVRPVLLAEAEALVRALR